jgi:hypothetical protein
MAAYAARGLLSRPSIPLPEVAGGIQPREWQWKTARVVQSDAWAVSFRFMVREVYPIQLERPSLGAPVPSSPSSIPSNGSRENRKTEPCFLTRVRQPSEARPPEDDSETGVLLFHAWFEKHRAPGRVLRLFD